MSRLAQFAPRQDNRNEATRLGKDKEYVHSKIVSRAKDNSLGVSEHYCYYPLSDSGLELYRIHYWNL